MFASKSSRTLALSIVTSSWPWSSRLTALVADAAGDPSLADRTWVLLTEAPDGGWGLAGHANTNEELVAAARAQIAELQAKKPSD